jgi:hypothetical protein
VELGISPDSAAVSLKAAVEALLKIMPRSKAEAMRQRGLFEKAGIITATTGQRALKQLLAEDKIDRIGKGVSRIGIFGFKGTPVAHGRQLLTVPEPRCRPSPH